MNLIAKIVAAKQGDTGFVLTNEHGENGDDWCAAIGNTSSYVPIGESIAYGDNEANFIAYGASPQAALDALLALVVAGADR